METDQPATAKEAAPRRIALLPGDDVGPEITDICRGLIADVFPHWELIETRIGWSQWRAHGNPIPQETWETLGHSDVILFAAVISKPAREAEEELAPYLRGTDLNYRPSVLQLRQRLDLFINTRPVTLPGVVADFTIICENIEGLYSYDYPLPSHDAPAGSPHHHLWTEVVEDSTVVRTVGKHDKAAVSLRVTTSFAWHRLTWQAAKLTLARQAANPDSEVTPATTVADKLNILRDSVCMIRRATGEVAEECPQAVFDFANADAVVMRPVTDPTRFDVIIAENLIGGILSDTGAGLVSEPGLVVSTNVDDSLVVFEPVHGLTPDTAGRGIANPAAFLLSAAVYAKHLEVPVSELVPTVKLREAVYAVTRTAPTLDLDGIMITDEFVTAVRAELGSQALIRLRSAIRVVTINPSR